MNFKLPRRFPLLPRRKDTEKSNYGHVLILAGSRGLTGAAVLASEAALLSGSGLVTLGVPKGLPRILRGSSPEVMKLELPGTSEMALSRSAYSQIARFIKARKINSLAIGPGLSQNKSTAALVRKLVQHVSIPVVLDADGLNSFRKRTVLFRKRRGALVLTPHKREFGRLFSQALPEDRLARIKLAKKISRFYHVVLVLKGHRTLVVSGDKVYENRTGNPGMAKGGTGDVLTGVLASFIGQGLDAFQAAVWAVYFHGKAGDIAVTSTGELSLTASDIINNLPKAFSSFINRN